MTESSLWISPLLILPGVALLILSTSVRFNRLHDELDHMLYGSHNAEDMLIDQLCHRGRLFRNALVGLYVAVAFLAAAGLSGAVFAFTGWSTAAVPAVLTAIAVGALVYAAILLIGESRASLEVIESHLRERRRESSPPGQ